MLGRKLSVAITGLGFTMIVTLTFQSLPTAYTIPIVITANDIGVRCHILLPPAGVEGWMVDSGCAGHRQIQEDGCWVACIAFHLLQLGFVSCLVLLSGWPLSCLEDLETGVFCQPCY